MMTCSATLRHNAGEAAADFDERRCLLNLVLRSGALGDASRRTLRKAACASAARLGAPLRLRSRRASPVPTLSRSPGPSGAELAPMLSPEARRPNFGDHGEARPLLAVFAATRDQAEVGASLDAALSRAEVRPRARPQLQGRRLRTIRRSSTIPPSGLRSRQRKARFRRRSNASSRVTIAATLSAQATGAPLAARSRPSMPGAFMRRYGSAKTA